MSLINSWRDYLVIAAILATLAVLGGIWYWGYRDGSAHIQALWDADKVKLAEATEKDRKTRQDAADKAEEEAAQKIQDLMVKNNKLAEQVNVEIAKDHTYRDCIVPANGVRAYRDAVHAGKR